jgi:hypothetical protein
MLVPTKSAVTHFGYRTQNVAVVVVDAVKRSSFQLNSDSFKSHQSRGSDASVYIGLTMEIAVLVSFWLR